MAEPPKRHWTTHVGQAAGHPAAFLVVIAYAVLWLTFDRATFDWNAVATLAVFVMTLFIQRANRRDNLALRQARRAAAGRRRRADGTHTARRTGAGGHYAPSRRRGTQGWRLTRSGGHRKPDLAGSGRQRQAFSGNERRAPRLISP
jgi:hypothetical protein